MEKNVLKKNTVLEDIALKLKSMEEQMHIYEETIESLKQDCEAKKRNQNLMAIQKSQIEELKNKHEASQRNLEEKDGNKKLVETKEMEIKNLNKAKSLRSYVA
jgi:hypothetical protein